MATSHWPELLEKAYAELNAEPDAPHGAQLNAASNSYAGISAGSGYALTEITGQAVTYFGSSSLTSDAAQIGAAWSAKEELIVGTSNIATGNIVADHMFEVTGFNAANGYADPPQSLGLGLFRSAGDDLHGVALLARRRRLRGLRDDRQADGLKTPSPALAGEGWGEGPGSPTAPHPAP